MKKRTAILLVSVLAAAFMQVGCGGGGGQDADSLTESTVSSEETATPQN